MRWAWILVAMAACSGETSAPEVAVDSRNEVDDAALETSAEVGEVIEADGAEVAVEVVPACDGDEDCVQACAEGRNDWVEVPKAGQKMSDLKSPAAALEILPGAGAGAHNH